MKLWKALVFIIVILGLACLVQTIDNSKPKSERANYIEPEETTIPPEVVYLSSVITQNDYTDEFVEAVMADDELSGRELARKVGVSYDDAFQLAKIMQAESGSNWPDWACMAIGEVVLNRVASPEFPDNIEHVLNQINPIQYEPVFYSTWETMLPQERFVKLALRLLQGERVLEDNSIVYQSLYSNLGDVIVSYRDTELGTTTYFSRSENLYLYGLE